MALYAIGYDLSKPGRNYEDLHDAIKALGPWAHAMDSQWLVRSDMSAAQIRDNLRAQIDANDTLIVVKMTGEWASYNMGQAQVDWLKQTV